jgi:uncharacterized protein YcbK (DUF882 family)
MSIDWTKIHYFKPDEFERPELLRWEMLKALEDLREAVGFPLTITSSYRDPAHNAAVGGVQDSAHLPDPTDGKYSGVDIATAGIGGVSLFFLLREVMHRFVRVGIYPSHIHLDCENRLTQQCAWVQKD